MYIFIYVCCAFIVCAARLGVAKEESGGSMRIIMTLCVCVCVRGFVGGGIGLCGMNILLLLLLYIIDRLLGTTTTTTTCGVAG